MLGGEPLLADASVRMWAQGKRGRVAQSLVSGLLLPKDVWFFSDGIKDSIVQRLLFYLLLLFIIYPFSSLCIPLSL